MKNLTRTLSELPWKIPKGFTKKIVRDRLVDMLISMNQINNCNSYYIRNSYEQKIIVDSPASAILCGHSIEVADADGFEFVARISNADEKKWAWLRKLFMETHKLFYSFPMPKRKHLVSRYDLEVKDLNEGNIILHHKVTPYQFCDNGNLWMSLCSATRVTNRIYGNPTVTNIETGEHLVFVNEQYILSDKLAITQEELMLLKLMCYDLSMEEIIAQLGIPRSSFHLKKQKLFDKLDVKTPTGAVHKAHTMRFV